MNLDDFIITCFCLIDDLLPKVREGKRVRERGPATKMAESEILMIKLVGNLLELSKETQIFAYFRRHYAHFFPKLEDIHRTTFTRQTANLWVIKERLWQYLCNELIAHDERTSIVDRCGLPVCRFARATRCKRFRGQARYGYDPVQKQTFYGFRLHARISYQGVITRFDLAPANEHDGAVVEELLEGTSGLVLGDRNYWLPDVQTRLRQQGVLLLAPYKKPKSPKAKAYESHVHSRVRYRIETVFGQLTEHGAWKNLRARDLWHLFSRLLRLVLMHTMCIFFNQQLENPPLQLVRLVA
jgi:hypothetical protein